MGLADEAIGMYLKARSRRIQLSGRCNSIIAESSSASSTAVERRDIQLYIGSNGNEVRAITKVPFQVGFFICFDPASLGLPDTSRESAFLLCSASLVGGT